MFIENLSIKNLNRWFRRFGYKAAPDIFIDTPYRRKYPYIKNGLIYNYSFDNNQPYVIVPISPIEENESPKGVIRLYDFRLELGETLQSELNAEQLEKSYIKLMSGLFPKYKEKYFANLELFPKL